MDNLLGMKELYEVALKATYPMKVGEREIEEGEIIALFDKVRISTTSEVKTHTAARGGYDNRALVHWDETKEVIFNFSQGVFSKIQLALLSNSRLVDISISEGILVPKTEEKESNEAGYIELGEAPYQQKVFVIDKETGSKLDYTFVDSKIIQIDNAFLDTRINYNFEYDKGATVIKIGQQLLAGFLRLEGKTRVKDDTTGHTVTGIITIPKLKLMSDLSMRLGLQADPLMANFTGVGYPVGSKGNKTVLDMVLLNDDIDSDI